MSTFLTSLNYLNKYRNYIHPITEQRRMEYGKYAKRIKKLSIRSSARDPLRQSDFDMAVSSVCLLLPEVDVPSAVDAFFSFQAVVGYLNAIAVRSSTCTESFLRLIYSSLKDALNLRTDSYENYFAFFPSKDDNGYLTILVEKCRQKVSTLPSYNVIRDYLSALLSLYIELQVTRFSSDDNSREVNLIKWSTAYGQKYPELSGWEFCMSVDSVLGIQLLLALGTDPTLTEQKTDEVYNCFYPWVCCIQKLLEGFLNHNDEFSPGDFNYDFYYENLKEYEIRLVYFIKKASKLKCRSSSLIRKSIKLLLSIYITHPKASEGMNAITGKALQKAGGRDMYLYTSMIKFLRARKYF